MESLQSANGILVDSVEGLHESVFFPPKNSCQFRFLR